MFSIVISNSATIKFRGMSYSPHAKRKLTLLVVMLLAIVDYIFINKPAPGARTGALVLMRKFYFVYFIFYVNGYSFQAVISSTYA
jgi:hypothetical protein